MVSTECLARSASALNDSRPGLHINEIKSVRTRLWYGRVADDLVLKHVLDLAVAHGRLRRRIGDVSCSGKFAMADLLSRDAVLGQLINQGAG